MGYTRKKTYTIRWQEGDELGPCEENPEGVIIKAKPTDIDTWLIVNAICEGRHPEQFNNDADEEFSFIIEEFGKCLVSWNMEEEIKDSEGQIIEKVPLPANSTGLRKLDREFVMLTCTAWCVALMTVNYNLKARSQNTEQSGEEPVPMEPLSENQLN